jgi:hypothetical protein
MLFLRIAMETTQRRKRARYDFPSPIEYRLMPDAFNKVFKGKTVNICDSGFSLCLSEPISKGQKIELIKDILPFPCQTAVVSWVIKDGDAYIAGFTSL